MRNKCTKNYSMLIGQFVFKVGYRWQLVTVFLSVSVCTDRDVDARTDTQRKRHACRDRNRPFHRLVKADFDTESSSSFVKPRLSDLHRIFFLVDRAAQQIYGSLQVSDLDVHLRHSIHAAAEKPRNKSLRIASSTVICMLSAVSECCINDAVTL